MIEDHGDDSYDLDDHLQFAQFAGLDSESLGGGDGTQAADQELATDDDNRNPCRNEAGIQLDQSDERGGDQEFVGQGIEENSHGRDLLAPAGEVAIDTVGDGGGNEDERGQEFLFSMNTGETRAGKDPHQQRDAEDATERDGVGQVH